MTSGRKLRHRAVCAVALCVATVIGVAASAGATGKGQRRVGGHVVGVRPMPQFIGPAGPTPLNPAGPTPLNPAGPTPLNPAGGFGPYTHRSAPVQRSGMYVGIVGGGSAPAPIGDSFYCQVHDRGYASQTHFFQHLADADGVYGDDALPYLIDEGGVWVFPFE
jgi:hypothetical protein